MWTFHQKTGILTDKYGKYVACGWSGNGLGKNNPDMQYVKNVGCLPQGLYTISAPVKDSTTGNYTLPLTPDPKNQMFGRGGFEIHGSFMGEVTPDGFAIINGQKIPVSEGCMIQPFNVRQTIWLSNDHNLQVTP